MRLKPAPNRARTALLPGLCALLLCACAGQPAPARDAETEALRARVERLEREAGTERAKLAADISAMREDLRALRTTLEETSRSLAASGPVGSGPAAPGVEGPPKPGQPGKSPRQALRDTLRNMLEVSREALERLNLELDKQLAQPQRQDKPER